MANVTEGIVFEPGIYRIETTDPVIGGENGIANIQAKQLASRTQYLKGRADQVDLAMTGFLSLGARLDQLTGQVLATGPDMQNMVGGVLKYALDQAAVANKSAVALQKVKQQEGQITFYNYGVISGCTLSKNTTNNRSLSLAAGQCFVEGRAYFVPANLATVSVPANQGASATTVYAYLYRDVSGIIQLGITDIGMVVPASVACVSSITIPAGNSVANDANLVAVTITNISRIEPLYPRALDAPISISVPINSVSDVDYQLTFDIVSYVGAPVSAKDILVTSRATNGFTVQLISASDDVVVRWKLSKLNN